MIVRWGLTWLGRAELELGQSHLGNFCCSYPPRFRMLLLASILGPAGPACRDIIRKRAASPYRLQRNIDAADKKVGGSNRCTDRAVQPGA
jgi:hypothetical protein